MYDAKPKYDDPDVDFASRPIDFEMLFDLEADPGEMDNLIESHADSEILKTLRTKCAQHSQTLNQRRQQFRNAVAIQRR